MRRRVLGGYTRRPSRPGYDAQGYIKFQGGVPHPVIAGNSESVYDRQSFGK